MNFQSAKISVGFLFLHIWLSFFLRPSLSSLCFRPGADGKKTNFVARLSSPLADILDNSVAFVCPTRSGDHHLPRWWKISAGANSESATHLGNGSRSWSKEKTRKLRAVPCGESRPLRGATVRAGYKLAGTVGSTTQTSQEPSSARISHSSFLIYIFTSFLPLRHVSSCSGEWLYTIQWKT